MLSLDPAALQQKVQQIEIRTRHLVSNLFAGEYHSVFRGRGLEFDEVRPYQPGDDIRLLDWNVTARMPEPYIKRMVEERELTVLLLVDASGSGDFGSTGQFKRELAAELAAVLAFAASKNHDKIGLLVFTETVELLIPPRRGRKHVMHLVRELLAHQPQSRGTNLDAALQTCNQLLKQRSIVFILSDFLIEPSSYRSSLIRTSSRHDVIAIEMHDPLEQTLPAVGLLHLIDAESGQSIWVDTNDKTWRAEFARRQAYVQTVKQATLRAAHVESASIRTDQDYVGVLDRFFRQRSRLRKRNKQR
jgi:uncharacterized protein (DUF58 family)